MTIKELRERYAKLAEFLTSKASDFYEHARTARGFKNYEMELTYNTLGDLSSRQAQLCLDFVSDIEDVELDD